VGSMMMIFEGPYNNLYRFTGGENRNFRSPKSKAESWKWKLEHWKAHQQFTY
jgi:hypothetical protein